MPRSAIMITRSRKLSLKLEYQLTHKTMICRSKCRPLNRSSIGTNRCISSSSPATLAFAPEPDFEHESLCLSGRAITSDTPRRLPPDEHYNSPARGSADDHYSRQAVSSRIDAALKPTL